MPGGPLGTPARPGRGRGPRKLVENPRAPRGNVDGGPAPYQLNIPAPPDPTGYTDRIITVAEANGYVNARDVAAQSKLLITLDDAMDYVIQAPLITRPVILRGGRNIVWKACHIDLAQLGVDFYPGADFITAINIEDGPSSPSGRIVHFEGHFYSGDDLGDCIVLAGADVELRVGYLHVTGSGPRSSDSVGKEAHGYPLGNKGGIMYTGVEHTHADVFKSNGDYQKLYMDRVTIETSATAVRFDHGETSQNYLSRINVRGEPKIQKQEGPLGTENQTWTQSAARATFETTQDSFTIAPGNATLTWPYTTSPAPLSGTQSLLAASTSPGVSFYGAGRSMGSPLDWSSNGQATAISCLVHILYSTTYFPMMRIDASDTPAASNETENWYIGQSHPVQVGVTRRLVCPFPREVLAAIRRIRVVQLVDDPTSDGPHAFIVDDIATGTGLTIPSFTGPVIYRSGGSALYARSATSGVGEPGTIYLRDFYAEPNPQSGHKATLPLGGGNFTQYDHRYFDIEAGGPGSPGYVLDPPPGDATLKDFTVPAPVAEGTDSKGAYITWNGAVGPMIRDWDTPNVPGSGKVYQGPPPNGDFCPLGIAGVNYVSYPSYAVDSPVLDLVWDLGPLDAYASEVQADAPWLYWRLGEASGTVFEDSTANNRDGTLTGSVTTYDAAGAVRGDDGAVAFNDASDGQIASSATRDWSAAWTVEGWFRIDAYDASNKNFWTTNAGLQMLTAAASPHTPLGFSSGLNGIGFTPESGEHDKPLRGPGEWQHLVWTHDGSANYKLYVDGVLWGTSAAALPSSTPATFRVSNANFIGAVDEVAVYDTVLSAGRVAAHYDAGVAHPGSSVWTNWDLRAQADSGVLDLVWDLIAQVNSPELDLKWDLRAEVNSAVLDLVSDLRSQVDSGVLDLNWDLTAQVNSIVLDLIWDLRAQVNSIVLDLIWDLRSQADSGVLDLLWDLRSQVDSTVLDLKWDLVAQVSSAIIDLLWDTRAEVNSNVLDLVWDLLNAAGQVNSAPLQVKWDLVAQTESSPLDLLWDLRSQVDSGVLDLLWDLRTQTDSDALDLLWDLRAQVSSGVLDLLWDLRSQADSGELDLKWDTRAQADSPVLTLKWDLRSQVDSAVLDLVSDLRAQADSTVLDLKWDLRAQVTSAQLRLLWDLASEAPSHIDLDGPLGLTLDGVVYGLTVNDVQLQLVVDDKPAGLTVDAADTELTVDSVETELTIADQPTNLELDD